MEEQEKEQSKQAEERAAKVAAARNPSTGKLSAYFINDVDGDLSVMAEELSIAEELIYRISPGAMGVAENEVVAVILENLTKEVGKVRKRLREHFELEPLEGDLAEQGKEVEA